MSGRLGRREFLGRTAAIGAGLAVLGRTPVLAAEGGAKSVVVKAVRDDAVADMKPNAPVVREMVHAVVMKLSGKRTPEDAWKQYVKPSDVVALKINCLFGVGAATHPEVTAAVVEGVRMAGVPAANILVWDRETGHMEKSGYKTGTIEGVAYVGVNGDWEEQPTDIHTCKGRLAKILTQKCTALINVPILKTHVIAGMTQALKNHYGSFHNPGDAHGGGCDPFLAELNGLKCIREKTRLIVSDALLPVADGGPQARPQWTWAYKAILASTDPVAIDYVGLKILDEQRAKIGKPPLESTGKAKCIATAAAKGLGAADMNRIDLVTA
jgi:uncharacterized protein (DUF362 family)